MKPRNNLPDLGTLYFDFQTHELPDKFVATGIRFQTTVIANELAAGMLFQLLKAGSSDPRMCAMRRCLPEFGIIRNLAVVLDDHPAEQVLKDRFADLIAAARQIVRETTE
jgi:hypothetical protein